ncbi:hypothetical protein LTR49_026561 [Elasticomyces elasticus]|nr:hypothetical protein LTR49_026561 [Elasticomyces elasticus]
MDYIQCQPAASASPYGAAAGYNVIPEDEPQAATPISYRSHTHLTPLILEADPQLVSTRAGRTKRGALRSSTQPKRPRRRRLSLYLTFGAAALIALNITQAYLIELGPWYQGFVWITAIPLAIMIVLLAVVCIDTILGHRELISEWRQTECRYQIPGDYIYSANLLSGAERWVRVGIVLTILVPIVICQFGYMPYVAVPRFERNGLETPKDAAFPAVVMVLYGDSNMTFDATQCIAGTDTTSAYQMSEVQTYQDTNMDPWQYITLNQMHQPNGTPIAPATSFDYSVEINITMRCKISEIHITYDQPFSDSGTDNAGIVSGVEGANSTGDVNLGGIPIITALYDPSLPFNISDVINFCGSPPPYLIQEYPISSATTARVNVIEFDDPIA